MKKRWLRILALPCLAILAVVGYFLGTKVLYLPEKVEIYYNEHGAAYVYTYEYDENGFLTEIRRVGSNTAPHTIAITCDKNGNVLREQDDQVIYEYTYSASGNMLSQRRTLRGKQHSQIQWEYNSKQQVIYAYHVGNMGVVMEYHYEYDEDGKLLTILGFRNDKQVYKTVFEHDENGRLLVEIMYNTREKEFYRVDYSYEDGKTVALFCRGSSDSPTRYVFDEAGNMVEFNSSRTVYTYKKVRVLRNSPRRSYTGQRRALSATGLTTLWG